MLKRDSRIKEDFITDMLKQKGSMVTYKDFLLLTNEIVAKHIPERPPRAKQKCYWEDDEVINARKEAHKLKMLSKKDKMSSSNRMANDAILKLSQLYNKKFGAFIEEHCKAIENLTGDNQYKAAWETVNLISGKNSKQKGLIPANSPEERQEIFKTHFKNLLAPALDKDSLLEEIPLYQKLFKDGEVFLKR